MSNQTTFRVGSFEIDASRFYDPATHLWVAPTAAERARCGLDPLGAATCGDIVAVSFEAVGGRVEKGEPLGWVEAAKFVGPLAAPVAGVIVAHNPDPMAEPARLNEAPLAAWLIELESAVLEADLAGLVTGREALEPWFAAEIQKFERQGMIAE